MTDENIRTEKGTCIEVSDAGLTIYKLIGDPEFIPRTDVKTLYPKFKANRSSFGGDIQPTLCFEGEDRELICDTFNLESIERIYQMYTMDIPDWKETERRSIIDSYNGMIDDYKRKIWNRDTIAIITMLCIALIAFVLLPDRNLDDEKIGIFQKAFSSISMGLGLAGIYLILFWLGYTWEYNAKTKAHEFRIHLYKTYHADPEEENLAIDYSEYRVLQKNTDQGVFLFCGFVVLMMIILALLPSTPVRTKILLIVAIILPLALHRFIHEKKPGETNNRTRTKL